MFNHTTLWKFLQSHGQLLINIYLFLNFAGWCLWQTYQGLVAGNFGYVEISFTIEALVLAVIVLLRKPHQAIETNWFNQAVALAAFLSGAAFVGQPATATGITQTVSEIVVLIATVVGFLALLSLGRSFGILIAFREVKATGLYAIVRHPMYGTDILLRTGFVISHFTPFTVAVFMASTTCYVYRALLEERFLSQQPEYQAYMQKVRYRFIPWVF